VLFEILIKAGYPLASGVKYIQAGKQNAFSISEGNLIICLETPIHADTLRAIISMEPKPVQVICLDHAFEGNDQLKTNLKLEMQANKIEFRTL
jgi:adenine-specific DNA-methyltransferase